MDNILDIECYHYQQVDQCKHRFLYIRWNPFLQDTRFGCQNMLLHTTRGRENRRFQAFDLFKSKNALIVIRLKTYQIVSIYENKTSCITFAVIWNTDIISGAIVPYTNREICFAALDFIFIAQVSYRAFRYTCSVAIFDANFI